MNKNQVMNEKFFSFNEAEKLEVLNKFGIDESTFKINKFRGVPREIAINDIWNSFTNSQKRKLML